MAWQGAFPGFEKRNKVRFLTRKQTVPLTCTLGSANHRFTARNLPAGTAVFHFPRCEADPYLLDGSATWLKNGHGD